MKLLKKGKVKDIYDLEDGRLLFKFTDRISAFDIVLLDKLPSKGEVLCRFAEYYFETLDFPNHMLDVPSPNEMTVKKLELVPIECVVRGYLYGSLYERVLSGQADIGARELVLAEKLETPYFDPTTKFEEKDRPVTQEEILKRGWLEEDELLWIQHKSISLYEKMAWEAFEANFILADVKFEFGREGGEIILADSIGPDEFRLWPQKQYQPGRPQESFDKQVIRDWLIKTGFKDELEDARSKGKTLPPPPHLPEDLIQEASRRYIYAYETLTKRKFKE